MGVDEEEGRKGSEEEEDDWWQSMMPKLPDPNKDQRKKKRRMRQLWVEEDKFTEEEMKVLVEEVTKREKALFGEYKQNEAPKDRWLLWLEVADKINEVSVKFRNIEQVRIKWFEYKDKENRYISYSKALMYKRSTKASSKKYWELCRRRIHLKSHYRAMRRTFTPPQPILQYASGLRIQQTLSQSNASTLNSNVPVSQEGPLQSNDNANSSEDVVIINEVPTKDPNKEYELIVIDDDGATNEGGKPNASSETATGDKSSQPDGAADSEIDETFDILSNLSEEERVQRWLALSDEERKARIGRILQKLKRPPPKNPQPPTPKQEFWNPKRPQAYIQTVNGPVRVSTLLEQYRNSISVTIAEKVPVITTSTSSQSSSNIVNSNNNPSESSQLNPSDTTEIIPCEHSSTNSSDKGNPKPSGNSDTNSSRSDNRNTSESCTTNPSGDSATNIIRSNDTNTSRKGDSVSSDICNISPSESSIGKISEVFSLVSDGKLQNLPSCNPVVPEKAILRLVSENAGDKVMNQMPAMITGPSKITATLSVPTVGVAKDLGSISSIGAPCITQIPQVPCIQNLLLQPFGSYAPKFATLVPINQPIMPPVVVNPPMVGELVVLGKERENVNAALNMKESSSRNSEDSQKEIVASSTSTDARSKLLKEIFGSDAINKSTAPTSEQPVKSHFTISDVHMEGSDETTSISIIAEGVRSICSDNLGAGTNESNDFYEGRKGIVSKVSSPKGSEGIKSDESINDGLKPIVEKPTKVYCGKSALQKRPPVTDLNENKSKQTLQSSVGIGLTNQESVNSSNRDGNEIIEPTFVQLTDIVTGNSIYVPPKKLSSYTIVEPCSIQGVSCVIQNEGKQAPLTSSVIDPTNQGSINPDNSNGNVMSKPESVQLTDIVSENSSFVPPERLQNLTVLEGTYPIDQGNLNSRNRESNEMCQSKLVQLTDIVSGKSFYVPPERLQSLKLLGETPKLPSSFKMKVAIPKKPAPYNPNEKILEANEFDLQVRNVIDKMTLNPIDPQLPAIHRKDITELKKVHTQKTPKIQENVNQVAELQILPEMTPAPIIQGNADKMPKLQKFPDPKISPVPIIQGNANQMPKLQKFPAPEMSPVPAIQENTGQMGRLQNVITQKVPLLLRKGVLSILKPPPPPVYARPHQHQDLLPQDAHVSTPKIEKMPEAPSKPTQKPDDQEPEFLYQSAKEGTASSAVSSQKYDTGPSVSNTPTTAATYTGGRKRARKDLGKLRHPVLLDQPVVILDRLSKRISNENYTYRVGKGNKIIRKIKSQRIGES